MILSTVPGMVTLGCSGIWAVSRFSSAILVDSAMRGFAICLRTLARVALAVSFLSFLCVRHPSLHYIEIKHCSHVKEVGAVSMELSGKGSFQAVKLQRPARTTVCSHSTRDMAASVRSNPGTMIRILRMTVCPVVDTGRKKAREACCIEPVTRSVGVSGKICGRSPVRLNYCFSVGRRDIPSEAYLLLRKMCRIEQSQ